MKTDQVTMTLLFDEYGALLTEKQQLCFDLYFNQDLSLAEIAEHLGVSRQGVHDTILRAEATLREMETALGNVASSRQTKAALAEIDRCVETLARSKDEAVQKLAAEIAAAAAQIRT